ncbi:MAG: hypothetical protein F6J93_21645 [Oscillatoria sp. SIO1A7]|nr:hypothetical protein [Oscillatoria sp. SIO1A7]
MTSRILPTLALLSLVCAGCQSSPLKQPQGPPPLTYDIQVNHIQIVVRLSEISFGEDSTTVSLAITNGRRQAIDIKTNNGIVLYDDQKHQYNLSIPPDTPTITIQPATTLKGKFVFIGRLSPKARTINLVIETRKNFGNKYSIGTINLNNIDVTKKQ